jgi:hypothetical protein
MAGPTVCETRWSEILNSFGNNRDDLLARHPDCNEEIGLIRTALLNIEQLIHTSPPPPKWKWGIVGTIGSQGRGREDRAL